MGRGPEARPGPAGRCTVSQHPRAAAWPHVPESGNRMFARSMSCSQMSFNLFLIHETDRGRGVSSSVVGHAGRLAQGGVRQRGAPGTSGTCAPGLPRTAAPHLPPKPGLQGGGPEFSQWPLPPWVCSSHSADDAGPPMLPPALWAFQAFQTLHGHPRPCPGPCPGPWGPISVALSSGASDPQWVWLAKSPEAEAASQPGHVRWLSPLPRQHHLATCWAGDGAAVALRALSLLRGAVALRGSTGTLRTGPQPRRTPSLALQPTPRAQGCRGRTESPGPLSRGASLAQETRPAGGASRLLPWFDVAQRRGRSSGFCWLVCPLVRRREVNHLAQRTPRCGKRRPCP